MRCVILLVAVVAVAYAAPEKRFVLDTLGNILSIDALKADIQLMLDTLGSDPTEQLCEQTAHRYFKDGLVTHSIPLICHSFQELVHHFNLVPQTTTMAA